MRVNGEEFSTIIRESISSDGIFAAPGMLMSSINQLIKLIFIC